MTAFTSRLYGGSADLQAMIDLLIAARASGQAGEFPGVGDLQQLLARPELQATTRLWQDSAGRLAGFAIVHLLYDQLLFEVAPPLAAGDLVAQIIAWAEACVRRADAVEGLPVVTLNTSCRADDHERIALLERHGFVPQPVPTLHMVRPLDEPIAAPELPPGFSIRPVAGEQEVEALVALHRAAFGTDHLTVEDRLGWMRAPAYDPALDLVAVAPDGTLAAYLFCSISPRENALTGRREGHTDPAGTHPAFRRRGLARALFLTGLRLLQERGAEVATFSTWGENIALQEMARSVGYRVQAATIFFEKRVA